MSLFHKARAEKPPVDWSRAYFAAPKFYGKPDGAPFGAIALTEGTETVLPKAPQKEYAVDGKPVADWKIVLVSTTKTEGRRCSNELAWSRVIWDITTVAWLLDERFMEDYLMPSPIPEYDGHYSVDPKRHLMRYVYHVNRDKVFSDLFTKLANFG